MSKLNVKDTNINCSIEMWAALTLYVTSDCQFVSHPGGVKLVLWVKTVSHSDISVMKAKLQNTK